MENQILSINNQALSTLSEIDNIKQMLAKLYENQESIKAQIKPTQSPENVEYIDVDMREIEAFSYVHQMFDNLFSRLNYSQEYIPFWLIQKERSFLEKKLNKSLKFVTKQYKKQLRVEKKRLFRKQWGNFLRKFSSKKFKDEEKSCQ